MGGPLNFQPQPSQPGIARSVSAFLPGGIDKDGMRPPLVIVTAALGHDRVGLEWITDMVAYPMYFTAAQARSVAAELLASADEVDDLARLEAEVAPAIAELEKGTP